MNLLEDCGGRICGTDYMFCHALDLIPRTCRRWRPWRGWRWPIRWSARRRIGRNGSVAEMRRFGAEAVVISRIPGASHCARKGRSSARSSARSADCRCVEIEVPPITDAMRPTLRTRLEALVETVSRNGEADDVRRNRCRLAGDQGRADRRRRSRGSWPPAQVDQGVEQDRLACELFERLLGRTAASAGRTFVGSSPPATAATPSRSPTRPSPRSPATRWACITSCPDARTVIDIGGQDSKLIRLDDGGRVRDFAMNDRCAAGTGRFLEVVADRLGVSLDDLGPMAAGAAVRPPSAACAWSSPRRRSSACSPAAGPRGHRRRRADGHRGADRRHGRPQRRAADRLHRRRGPHLRAWRRRCRRPSAGRWLSRPSPR